MINNSQYKLFRLEKDFVTKLQERLQEHENALEEMQKVIHSLKKR